MKGSILLLSTLKNNGIEYIFGIPGGEAQNILFNEIEGIKFILTKHEFTAAIMASIYGRLTGKIQVCWTTYGPGAANVTNGIASAYLDRLPLLVISAQVDRNELKYGIAHQCIDQKNMMKPITKSASQINSIKQIPQNIKKAINLSIQDPMGPTFISIPKDILKEDIPDKEAKYLMRQKVFIKEKNLKFGNDKINKLHRLILNSKSPLIYVGSEVDKEDVKIEFKKFVEKYKIPVLATFSGKNVLDDNHPLSWGTFSTSWIKKLMKKDIEKSFWEKIDLLILIGIDNAEGWISLRDLLANSLKKFYVVRIDGFRQNLYGKVNLDIVGDIKSIFQKLNKLNSPSIERELSTYLDFEDLKRKFLEESLKNKKILPQNIISVINEIFGKNCILISDIGLHKQYAGLFTKANTFIHSHNLSTFGFGLPAAMGAKLAFSKKHVIAICGDGGFHSSSQDLETAVRYRLPIICIVMKDNSYGLIKFYQKEALNKINPQVLNFGNVDFVKLAEANGCVGYKANDIDELKNILNKASKSLLPRIIEIDVEYEF